MVLKNFYKFLTMLTNNSRVIIKFKDIFGNDKNINTPSTVNTIRNCTSGLFTLYTLNSVNLNVGDYDNVNTGLFLGSGGGYSVIG